MGKSMVRNLMKPCFSVSFTQEPKARRWMLSKRVQSGDSIAQCVRDEVVITIVGYPKDVEEVYFGKDGILEMQLPNLPHRYDHHQSKVTSAFDSAADMGMHALDAP